MSSEQENVIATTPETIARTVEASITRSISPLCESLQRLHASLDELITRSALRNDVLKESVNAESDTRSGSLFNEEARVNGVVKSSTHSHASHSQWTPPSADSNSIDSFLALSFPAPASQGHHQALRSSDRSNKSGLGMAVMSAPPPHTGEKHERQQIRRVLYSGTTEFETTVSQLAGKAVSFWTSLEEPKRNFLLYRIATSQEFESFTAMVIIVNSIYVAIAADLELKQRGKSDSAMNTVDWMFMLFYIVELAVRFGAHRLYFFVNDDMKWNIFDFVLVVFSCTDIIVSVFLPENLAGGNAAIVRGFRIFKLAKILRALRVMRIFQELRNVLESFKNCFASLFWSLIMLVFTLYVFSLIFLQGIVGWQNEETTTQSDVDQANIHFGSVSRAMLSMYMAVTGGNDWHVYYSIIERTGGIFSFCYLFYTFFFAFALFNILTAIFVEKAVVASTPDREELILEQRRKCIKDGAELRKICRNMDVDHTGKITWDELTDAMTNEVMVAYLASVGLEVHDVNLFFALLAGDYEEDGIELERFVEGCMAMKGTATALDLQRQLYETRRLQRKIDRFEQLMFSKVDTLMSSFTQPQPRLPKEEVKHATAEVRLNGDQNCVVINREVAV